MTTKLSVEDVIRELLRTYNDVIGSASGGDGAHFSPEDRILWMSQAYHEGSYAQLEQALRRMRNQGSQQAIEGIPLRTLWWHLTERYIRSERRRRDVLVKLKGKNGKSVKVPQPQMVVVYSREYATIPKPRQELCKRLGIRWLADEFDRMGVVPFLPNDEWERVAA